MWRSPCSAIHLWGRSGRGHCRKFSAHFCEISANFPQNFRTLSWRNKTYFSANFREISTEFPQTFRKNPFANDPISELLTCYTGAMFKKFGDSHAYMHDKIVTEACCGYCLSSQRMEETLECTPPRRRRGDNSIHPQESLSE